MRLNSSSLGQIKAELADSIGSVPDVLIDKLNANCRPPEKLTSEDVNIRAMYIVSDEVNSYGGRFPVDEHERLVELLIDSPVLVGHRQDKLPVGRTFYAVQIERDGRHWVKSYFYWLKSADQGENLAKNIDGGVYKECSIGFSFRLPECSICGKDIRLCEHEPFAKYSLPGGEGICHFNYRQIEKVLETSLVYRGAIRNTSISNELSQTLGPEPGGVEFPLLKNTDDLDQAAEYLILPRYDSISCRLRVVGDKLLLTDDQNHAWYESTLLAPSGECSQAEVDVRLVGMRGKERCSLHDLKLYLATQSGPVSRLMLYTLPNGASIAMESSRLSKRIELKSIPFRRGKPVDLDRLSREIMTRDGVELWSFDESGQLHNGYLYHPARTDTPGRFRLITGNAHVGSCLELAHDTLPSPLTIANFDRFRLHQGSRFVAEMSNRSLSEDRRGGVIGNILNVANKEDGYRIELSGPLQGRYLLRRIRLQGRDRWLFYRATLSSTPPERVS